MTWFMVVGCSSPLAGMYTDAVFIELPEGEGAEVAAAEGAITFANEEEDLEPGYLDTVFVVQFDPEAVIAFNKATPSYDRAPDEFQCCGGLVDGVHTGLCPVRLEADKHQREAEDHAAKTPDPYDTEILP